MKWKILDFKNLGVLYTSQNCLRTALLIGSGHGGCFNENGKFQKNIRKGENKKIRKFEEKDLVSFFVPKTE